MLFPGFSRAAQGLLPLRLKDNLLRSLLLGLTALLVALLLPGCLWCAVRLRDRRGALGLANGPELQVSRFLVVAFGAPDGGSLRAFTGTIYAYQFFSTQPDRFTRFPNLDAAAGN